MKTAYEITNTVFFCPGNSAWERSQYVKYLSKSSSVNDSYDDAVRNASDAYIALLLDEDPKDSAETTFRNCQKVSTNVLGDHYWSGHLASRKAGLETEVAVFNLVWWGIATQGIGRYVRMATYGEDRSTALGRKTGYDLAFRIDKRRHALQVKTKDLPGDINRYEANVTVVSPQILLQDREATTRDLHEAVSMGDETILATAWNSFVRELHTQKAPNSMRRII